MTWQELLTGMVLGAFIAGVGFGALGLYLYARAGRTRRRW